ncbi:MAG: hypothetical protein M1831_001575 [Alyxoria varia]|nr:MAG: hypothetical protein M1831_001575 [Alyxoria varia]
MPTSIETRSRFTRMAGHLAPSRRTSDKWNEKTGAAICLNLLVLSLSIPLLVFGSYAGAAYRHAERSSYGGDPDESGAYLTYLGYAAAAQKALNDRKSTTVAGHSTKPINLKIVAPQVDDNNV